MSFSDEEIIAFLLGDAEQGLASRIRLCLATSEELAERVSHLRRVLNHLDGVVEPFEPPADLIENTLSRIEASSLSPTCSSSSGIETGNEFDHPMVSCLAAPIEASQTGRGWLDSVALTLSLTVLCCLTVPAIIRARFESRRALCADNLRETGRSLVEYAMRRPDRRYPFVPGVGPESFSGVFVIRLKDEDLLPAGRLLPCASLNGMERPSFIPDMVVPSLQELCSSAESQIECMKGAIGGDYAYNLGVFEDGQLVAPKHSGSSYFAILADAPLIKDDEDQIIAHDGKGINILYDDGQVRFMNRKWIQSHEASDNPFRNMLGAHEAGISQLDASLAPSQYPPITLAH